MNPPHEEHVVTISTPMSMGEKWGWISGSDYVTHRTFGNGDIEAFHFDERRARVNFGFARVWCDLNEITLIPKPKAA